MRYLLLTRQDSGQVISTKKDVFRIASINNYVRDYLTSINFNKQPPAPDLPEEVILNTSKKYLEALNQLTGESINL